VSAYGETYGRLDRLLHRVAFATTRAQLALADLEERLFARELRRHRPDRPVLITALPRGGTTMLLEIVAAMPEFASHRYRDMPFVLAPMLWQRIAKRLRRSQAPRERAHGDGIEITIDSPEAFEEMLWKRFWPERYRGPAIAPWSRLDRPAFTEFLRQHIRKIVALRAREQPAAKRYVSKNNSNVARVPAIWQALPDAILLVPFREPLQHAASLLRQHRRFAALQQQDRFTRRYMTAIGHHDFGLELKPIDFDGWLASTGTRDPMRFEFWLEYWIATYRHLLRHADCERLHLISFEALASAKDAPALARCLQTDALSELRAQMDRLEPVAAAAIDRIGLDEALLGEARRVHVELLRRARI
jgi:hypothetical protein